MNINSRQQKLIEKYLDKNLNTNQLKEFEEEIKSKEFREQLLFQARLVDSYKDIRRESLRKEIDAMASPKSKKGPNKKTLFFLIGIIAIAILFFAFYNYMNNNNKSEDLYAQYFLSLPPDVSNRGDNDLMPKEYQQAMQSYINKDFETALVEFNKLSKPQEKISLYKAMCQMEIGQILEAKNNLTPLLESKESSIKQNVEWYLSLIAIQEGDITEAKGLLDLVLKTERHLYHDEARKLKEEL